MELKDLNPWWKTGQIPEEFGLLPKRDLFEEIVRYVPERQIIVITGLRRTGKTVLMHHLIESLLKSTEFSIQSLTGGKHHLVPMQENSGSLEEPTRAKRGSRFLFDTGQPEKIIYFNFDLLDDKIENILKTYREVTGLDFRKEKLFVFLDEIQKHQNWENELKILYDFSNIKFFISGSSSLFIEKKTKESLAGRTFSFILSPLTFKEYLKLKKIEIEEKKIILFKDELIEALRHYGLIGGFPELLEIKEGAKINKYLKELIIDRVVYIDIPKVFDIEEPELLSRLLSIVSASPGMLTDYESLADDLNRNRKTISNYLFYLEKAFLIKKIYNYSKNLLTSEKKLKKLYPASTAFAFLYNAEYGKIIETIVLMNQNFSFFSRFGNKEVDFIKVNGKTLPIEIKFVKKVKENEIKGLLSFMAKNGLKEGLVITEDYSAEEKIEEKEITFIPLWKWLLG